ncbi:hypothetical protein FRB95_001453 [Tulasnella sp. JGI-2019a]|nr:hypothetical protein FRB95_001453 [Tulasnella sp. JGI-2019a]
MDQTDLSAKISAHRLRLNPQLIEIPNPSRPVGGGGYCDMFRGIYTSTRLHLALKRPRFCTLEPKATEDVMRRFRREGKLWSALDHINILPFLGMVDIGGETYLVSPWLEHGDLSKFVPARLEFLELPGSKRLSHPSRRVFERFDEWDIIFGVASGLAYLHEMRVIHGDIKAANVLLDIEVRPALCDFGLTKVLDGANSLTSTAMQGAGSLRWMSPEMLSNSPRTWQTDIYALGLTIIEILTGQVPFADRSNQAAVTMAIMQGQSPATLPSPRDGKSFHDVWCIASPCWNKDAGQRPSALNIVDKMAALRQTTATHCDDVSTPKKKRRFSERQEKDTQDTQYSSGEALSASSSSRLWPISMVNHNSSSPPASKRPKTCAGLDELRFPETKSPGSPIDNLRRGINTPVEVFGEPLLDDEEHLNQSTPSPPLRRPLSPDYLPPLPIGHSRPHRIKNNMYSNPPPKPVTQPSSISPAILTSWAPSYQTIRSGSSSGGRPLGVSTMRTANMNGQSPTTRSAPGRRPVSKGQFGGDMEIMESDVGVKPMPTLGHSQAKLHGTWGMVVANGNTLLPSRSSFGDMYQFDQRYSDADLDVVSTSTAMIPALTDLAIDPTQLFVAMKAIGMDKALGLSNHMNLAPAEITILEQFHRTLSSPAQIIDPMPFVDLLLGHKELELLYIYRGQLCNLQYHIAHSTDASIADELFNMALTSNSALYGTLTLTSLFKIMTSDFNSGSLDEALLELQFFKDKVAKGLGEKMRDPPTVDSGDAMAGLHMVSAVLFEGGTNAQWEKFLDVAKAWVQNHPIVKRGSWRQSIQPHRPSPESRASATRATSSIMEVFIIKVTAWFDIIGSVTMRRKPHFLSTYQELFGRQGGAMMEGIMGCDERVLLAIAETAALAEWRHDMERKNCLSFMDLAHRANKIEPLLQSTGPVYSGASFIEEISPSSTIGEHDTILGMDSTSHSNSTHRKSHQHRVEQARSAHHIQLVSNVFRAAAKLYLYTVVSGCNPDVKEIKDGVSETVIAFEHLQASMTDRSLVFPVTLAGCMTDNLKYRKYLMNRLKALGTEGEAVGNLKRCVPANCLCSFNGVYKRL